MTISLLWQPLGGLALFILGMRFLSEGLQKIAGDKLRRFLERTTGNRLTGALLGSCLASLLQSSSAASILVVGFVNAGLISLYQALGVLLGTGLGTTLAVQFIAFKVASLAFPALFLGVLLKFFGKRRRWVYVGELLVGAGLVFLGIQIMEAGFAPARQSVFATALHSDIFSWHIVAALFGACLTFLMQSSSTATGIVIALAGSGLVGFETGVAIIVGEVLGTALIAVIATISGTRSARRTALLYFGMNLFAVAVALAAFPILLKGVALISPGEAEQVVMSGVAEGQPHPVLPNIARHLANAHTVFSAITILMFLPLVGFLARSVTAILPGREGEIDVEPRPKFIDQRVLNTPTIAFLQARNELRRMSGVALSMFDDVHAQFHLFQPKRATDIDRKEEVLDVLQRDLSVFLLSVARRSPPQEISAEIPTMLRVVSDLEHIGDLCRDVADYLRRKKEGRILFSPAAMNDIREFAATVRDPLAQAITFLNDRESGTPGDIAAVNIRLSRLEQRIRDDHLGRLSSGSCTVNAGVLFEDIITAFAKIAYYSCTIIEAERDFLNVSTGGSD